MDLGGSPHPDGAAVPAHSGDRMGATGMSCKACFFTVAIAVSSTVFTDDAEPLALHDAGSLEASLIEVVNAFEQATGSEVRAAFGPSGLIRQRIESGEGTSMDTSLLKRGGVRISALASVGCCRCRSRATSTNRQSLKEGAAPAGARPRATDAEARARFIALPSADRAALSEYVHTPWSRGGPEVSRSRPSA